MLTSDQSIVEYKGGRAFPDRLTQGTHRHYAEYAARMLAIYRQGVGQPRYTLHRQVEAVFADEPDCPVRRIGAFCKLLDDASDYQTDPSGEATKLRLKVFSLAAQFHPLVAKPERLFECVVNDIKARIVDSLGRPWETIEQILYSDVLDYQRLERFEGYADPAALLSRYNVAQLQAGLYKAEQMTVWASEDFKTILRYAKLARLLHEIERVDASTYRLVFSGPASVLSETRRYGVSFARFLPALLACRRWRMTASLKTPWNQPVQLVLSDKDGFTSHLPPPEMFDSSVEQSFCEKFGTERDGWTLTREGDILHHQQKTFVPDFTFCHADGTKVLMEIVGFWTPEYLAGRRQTLRLFRDHKIILAVPEKSIRDGATVSDNVLVYKTALKLTPLMEILDRFRAKNAWTHWRFA
jgi:predicted nuclease of restriction endonuclease-like RecB superfamily